MSFGSTFKNIGHYFAVGFKYVAVGVSDIVTFANKAQPLAPEVEALAGAFAGPLGNEVASLAFNVLGETAAALQNVNVDLTAGQHTMTLTLATQTALDIKAAATQIEQMFAALKLQKPA
jgi:hypothetical protein